MRGHYNAVLHIYFPVYLGRLRGIETLRESPQVHHHVHEVDSSVDEDATSAGLPAGPPGAGYAVALGLDLYKANVSDVARLDNLLASLHGGEKPVVLRYHQFYAGILSRVDHPAGLVQVPGNGLFHKDMLGVLGGEQCVIQMHVVRRGDVNCVNPRVPYGLLVASEETRSTVELAVLPGLVDIPAREIELELVRHVVYVIQYGLSIPAASDDAHGQFHGLPAFPGVFQRFPTRI